MEVAICTLVGLVTGYLIGVIQNGMKITINNGIRPLAPKGENDEPVYNQDSTHLMPPDMQEYFLKNNGQMK